MKKTTFTTITLFCVIAQVFPQDSLNQQRIGIARINYIMLKLPEMKQIETELQEYQDQLKQMYNSKVKSYETKYNEYVNIAKSLSDDAAKNYESDLLNLQESIRRFENEAQYAFVERQTNLIKPAKQKVYNSITEVAEQYNYSLILNYEIDDIPIVLHYHDSLDISDMVLSRLGIEE